MIDIIFKVVWGVCIFIGIIFTSYTAYLEHNIKQEDVTNTTLLNVKTLNSQINDIQINISNLAIKVVKLQDFTDQINHNLDNVKLYQDVLRKEIQNVAENKLNITEFWRYIKDKKV